jgi:hypothetical protein
MAVPHDQRTPSASGSPLRSPSLSLPRPSPLDLRCIHPGCDPPGRGNKEGQRQLLSKLAGPAIGGLLNVTFGNVAEFILAVFILAAGSSLVVNAQITGSIIGNGLLGLGVAIIAGTFGQGHKTFQRESAGMLSSW